MTSVRKFVKRISHPFLNKWIQYYYRKPRVYRYDNIEATVHPEVFPPQLTLSTKILLNFIQPMDFQGKSFLELGCGSGIISLLASKKNAVVTASDINQIALDYLVKSSEKNKLKVRCIHSNLFESISEKHFDYIIINPPFYPNKATNIKEKAWYCGENFEYFEALFEQLRAFLSEKNTTYMILSEDCDFQKIVSIAQKNNINMTSVVETKKMGELNTIYSIQNKL